MANRSGLACSGHRSWRAASITPLPLARTDPLATGEMLWPRDLPWSQKHEGTSAHDRSTPRLPGRADRPLAAAIAGAASAPAVLSAILGRGERAQAAPTPALPGAPLGLIGGASSSAVPEDLVPPCACAASLRVRPARCGASRRPRRLQRGRAPPATRRGRASPPDTGSARPTRGRESRPGSAAGG